MGGVSGIRDRKIALLSRKQSIVKFLDCFSRSNVHLFHVQALLLPEGRKRVDGRLPGESSSIFAARMKSFSVRPLATWVHSSTRTWPQLKNKSGW